MSVLINYLSNIISQIFQY